MQFSFFIFTVLFTMYALLIQAAPLHKRESGEATYYNLTGLTSCGELYSDDDLVVAVSEEIMGTGGNPNNNPLCGKKLTVNGPKGTVKVKIVDTCPSCPANNLDLSPAAFKKIGTKSKGRIPITWSGL